MQLSQEIRVRRKWHIQGTAQRMLRYCQNKIGTRWHWSKLVTIDIEEELEDWAPKTGALSLVVD